MEDKINKKWKVWCLKTINLSGGNDVTNTNFTLFLVSLLIFSNFFYIFPPKPTNMFFKLSPIIIFFMSLFILYTLIYKSKNFILFNFLYQYLLKVKIVTIEDFLNPTIPVIEEIEKIVTQKNKNCINTQDSKCPNLQEGITFFWIRKDRLKNQERNIKYFIPYLGLIMILYALKEKSLKLISTIGFYFVIIGLLFISSVLLFIRYLKATYHIDNFLLGIFLILLLALWYIMTIYSALKVVSIDIYINNINQEVRRAYLRSSNIIGKGYEQIIKSFEKESAVYIYDYTIDKYQLVDRKFLYKKLNSNYKFIIKNIGIVITTILSVIFMLFVEASANFITSEINHINNIDYTQLFKNIFFL